MGNTDEKAVQIESLEDIACVAGHLINKRLRWSHQTNIYPKCELLKRNYSRFDIEEIYLENNLIQGETVELLCSIGYSTATIPLKVLCLSQNSLDCDSLKHFRKSTLNNLAVLYLDHNRISNDGCYYLSRTNFPVLQTLDLSGNKIGDEGAKHLSQANLPCLVNLLISENVINEKGLLFLSKAEWPMLAFLQIKSNSFQPQKRLETIKFRSQIKQFRIEIE